MNPIAIPTNNLAKNDPRFSIGQFKDPSSSQEIWKYAPIRKLTGFLNSQNETKTGEIWDFSQINNLSGITTTSSSIDSYQSSESFFPADMASAIAYSRVDSFQSVSIAKNANIEESLIINLNRLKDNDVYFSLLKIELAEFSQANLYINASESANLNENVEITIADEAKLNIVFITDLTESSINLASHQISLGKNSEVNYYYFTLGGGLVRVTPRVEFRKEGATANLFGVYFATDNEYIEHRLSVEHSKPNCKSRVVYKGALQNVAKTKGIDTHTVWVGDVVIRPPAEGTDTYEINRNLLLTPFARADSVPNLEIETGEIVSAGHASATGRLSDEEMFYLNSRGISEDIAKKLIVRGFFQEVIGQLNDVKIKTQLTEKIEFKLKQTNN